LLAGLVFGAGLVVSQMINPKKVLDFLDVAGGWDPSLGLVIASALAVTAIGYRLAWRASRPAFDERFQVPTSRTLDKRLMIGAVMFGIGWGLVGLCPGPALAGLSLAHPSVYVFVAAMTVGMALFEIAQIVRLAMKGSRTYK
jgi:uncharacterized membrane protein YedE/YeeE